MTNLKWALVGIPIALVVLGAAGVSVTSVLPLAFLVVGPMMMMGMHGGHGKGSDHSQHEQSPPTLDNQER